MGAWGVSAFENDDAADWLYDLEAGEVEVVRAALTNISEGYLEAPDGCVAIAAAEIVAAAHGLPSPELPESATAWVAAHGGQLGKGDVQLALKAVERVQGEESELAELWDDADDPGWTDSIEDLTARLHAAAGS